ncbi:MAG: hypothetical protein GX957_01295 [Clostridiaceae bacterium]|nr:hypothetical protein [Clostridiaceae bacterium]
MEVNTEAQKSISRAQQALNMVKKEIPKEEKKQIKADISSLQKLLMKNKPVNMSESDIFAIRDAIIRLDSSSANACSKAGNATGKFKEEI